jgi:hypothetical protein
LIIADLGLLENRVARYRVRNRAQVKTLQQTGLFRRLV